MIYRIMPERYRRGIGKMLEYVGSRRSAKSFTNSAFYLSLLGGILAGLFSGPLFPLVTAGIFVAIFVLFHGLLSLAIDRRAGFVETILPDALQLMAANSRAGYIPSRALIMSARDEFGPLSEAIKKAGKEMATGRSLEESLNIVPQSIKSEVLEKTIKLIIEGTKSGGQFAELLDNNAEDIRRGQGIKKEVRASVTMYIIFIGFAACVGAPALYALSTFLIVTIGNLGASAQIPESVASQVNFIQFTGVEISGDFLFFFSLAAILITTFFGGMIIGSIATGKEKAGIKYSPVLMVAALLVFYLTRAFIETSFGSLIPK